MNDRTDPTEDIYEDEPSEELHLYPDLVVHNDELQTFERSDFINGGSLDSKKVQYAIEALNTYFFDLTVPKEKLLDSLPLLLKNLDLLVNVSLVGAPHLVQEILLLRGDVEYELSCGAIDNRFVQINSQISKGEIDKKLGIAQLSKMLSELDESTTARPVHTKRLKTRIKGAIAQHNMSIPYEERATDPGEPLEGQAEDTTSYEVRATDPGETQEQKPNVVFERNLDVLHREQAARTLEYRLKKEQTKINKARRVSRVTAIFAAAASFAIGLFGLDSGTKHMSDHLAEVEQSLSSKDLSPSEPSEAIYSTKYDTQGDIKADTPSELAQKLVMERNHELSALEQNRLAAASTNVAIMALTEDAAPHVNPSIPANLSIKKLETWGGYQTPISAFDDHLAQDGRTRKDASTAELLEFVGEHASIGGESTEILMDRMLGSVPSFALDETQSVEALTASMDMIIKGEVNQLASLQVESLKAKGHYNIDTPDQNLHSFNDDVNQLMEDSTDLPPDPLYVKPIAPKEANQSDDFEKTSPEYIDLHKLDQKFVEKSVVPDVTDYLEPLEEDEDTSLEDNWFTPEEPTPPVKKSWFSRAKNTVRRWFS